MTTTQQGTVNIRGVNHYYEWITTDTPQQSKPVMVFVHGWGGSCRYWRTTARALVDQFDCLLYDLRGFGQSAPSTATGEYLGYELMDYVEDLKLLLDAFNLDKIYLNSHSMGASIGALFVESAPERIIKAILTCNGIFEYNALTFSAFHQAGGYVVKFRYNWFLKVPMADKLFMARFLNKPIASDMSMAFLEDFLLADYQAALNTIYTAVSKQAVEIMPEAYKNIKVPTLLITGEKDQIIPPRLGKPASILNEEYISYVEIPQTGHFPMLEDEKTYLNIINNFL